jgi:NADH:ubiquinone oxidoreductase subunit 6 (subunit J)
MPRTEDEVKKLMEPLYTRLADASHAGEAVEIAVVIGAICLHFLAVIEMIEEECRRTPRSIQQLRPQLELVLEQAIAALVTDNVNTANERLRAWMN